MLTDQETFGMKSQKEGGFGPPRAVTPWKKKMYVKKKGDLADSHSILNRWKNHVSAIECTWC
jgi:hypothetical protein